MDAEDVLFILYTSGTTGKPKGIVHTTGGYLTHVLATTKLVFDLKDTDVYWCTADVGWVTGHSYVVYGPLALGATQVMYEGAPDWPERDRLWDIVERYGVTIFYTAPTAIRAFMKWGAELPERHDLSSLRLLGTVGEPINPEAWMWYHHNIGGQRCPIVDTWWQTETGGIMITPLPGVVATKPGSATRAFPGVAAEVVDGAGKAVQVGGGFLALTAPWPGMLRTIWGDDERYQEIYWSKWPGMYFPGDGAKRDEDGYFWLLGRVDDVLNVAGHRIGTMEIESALVDHPSVAEAAVVGKHHDLKGQAVAAFVTLKSGFEPHDELKDDLQGARGQEDRRDRPARRHPVRGRLAEDAQRQDHAPAAAGHRRGSGPRRHDHPGGSRRGAARSRRNTRKARPERVQDDPGDHRLLREQRGGGAAGDRDRLPVRGEAGAGPRPGRRRARRRRSRRRSWRSWPRWRGSSCRSSGRRRSGRRAPWTAEVVFGPAYLAITDAAARHGADLIVVATHGRTGLVHLLLGSVAERVARIATCPVLTVRVPG